MRIKLENTKMKPHELYIYLFPILCILCVNKTYEYFKGFQLCFINSGYSGLFTERSFMEKTYRKRTGNKIIRFCAGSYSHKKIK